MRPYLLVGWLWFLGTLVPVIGLVQVGGAAMADRYTYLPAIGIFIAVVFGLAICGNYFKFPNPPWPRGHFDFSRLHFRHGKPAAFLARQRNAFPPCRRRHTKQRNRAHRSRGHVGSAGPADEALADYRAAAKTAPRRYQIHNNLGNLLAKLVGPPRRSPNFAKPSGSSPTSPFCTTSPAVNSPRWAGLTRRWRNFPSRAAGSEICLAAYRNRKGAFPARPRQQSGGGTARRAAG